MPWGRGGAGNLAQADETAKRMAEDVEANEKPRDAEKVQSAAETKTGSQEWAHMGRGGAGNWYSPQELTSTGVFLNSADSKTDTQNPSKENTVDTRHRGRGGAGNFVWSDETDEMARKQLEEKEENIKANIAKEIEAGLAMPGKAVLRRDGMKD